MKAEISKFNRIKRDENYEVMESIKRTIADRINTEYNEQLTGMREENSNLFAEEKAFYPKAFEILSKCTKDTNVKIVTQVGKGSVVLNEYVGHVYRIHNKTLFDFISESRDNKPFTVGFSCLQSIEIMP